MKRILCLLMVIAMLSLTGCRSESLGTSSSPPEAESLGTSSSPPAPEPSINLDSLEELAQMRQMIECTDEAELKSYLSKIKGLGAQSREDLIDFVALVDRMPYFPLLDGEITWLYHQRGHVRDTGEAYEVFYVTTETENGDWFRIEYQLLVEDVSKIVEERQKNGILDRSAIKSPIQMQGFTVYAETREKHPSGTGELVRWTVEVDGLCATIVYYARNEKNAPDYTLLSTVIPTRISE